MRIIRFLHNHFPKWGVIEKGRIGVLEISPLKEMTFSKERLLLKEVTLLPPAQPGKIVLAGLNYKDHAEELNMPLPKNPVIFLKPPTSIIGPNQAIIYPQGVERLDYEAELAVVINKKAKDVEEESALDYVLGFTCLNDVTARDIQKKEGQWTRAKSFDTFCPIGPWIETELNPNNTQIKCYLNGELKQHSSTKGFIFSVERLLSFISKNMTLLPGDIISTGTPKGIGPMHPGDTVRVEIEGIGSLENYIVSYNPYQPTRLGKV